MSMSISIFSIFSIFSLHQNVLSLASDPDCSTASCTQQTRIGRQFWTDENDEKEEVLMVSIDTCIPISQNRSTSAVCDRPAAAV
jgi:hypothetical protein